MAILTSHFVYSIADGHLSCSQFLAIMKKILLSTFMDKIFCRHIFSFLLRMSIPKKGIAELFWQLYNFLGIAKLFSKVAEPFYIDYTVNECSDFSTPPLTHFPFSYFKSLPPSVRQSCV